MNAGQAATKRERWRPTILVYADASPKPRQTGLGLAVRNSEGHLVAWQGKQASPMTCNEAEYAAIVFALEFAISQQDILDVRRVLVLSDSKVVVEQMQSRISVNNPSLRVWHGRARALAVRLQSVRFEHIPRERNELADAMAEEASHEQRIHPLKPAPTIRAGRARQGNR